MSEPDRQSYAWQLPHDAGARENLAAAVYADGTRHVRVKAGGDQGAVWIPGGRYPASAGPQWSDAWLEPFTRRGMRVTPWFFNEPGEADKNAIVRALASRDCDEIALNPEAAWRVQSPDNPWRSLAEANEAAAAWVRDLRARLPHPVRIAFSSVPSWTDFPYEGFAAECDQAEEQHYWMPEMIAGNLDQVGWHLRRVGRDKPHVPILTASREYDGAGVLQLARNALAQDPDLAGFSSWECANGAYQHAAMAASYALLDGLGRRERLDFAASWRTGGTFTQRYRRWRAA